MPDNKPPLRWLSALETALAWLVYCPLLLLQAFVFFLVAWGRLGYELGAEDLFWSDHAGEQVLNGLACGLLFGEMWLVRYLLDPDRWRFSIRYSLFPVADADVRRFGGYLLLTWTASLVLLWGGKLFFHDVWAGQVTVWPLLVGLVLAVGASSAAIGLASRYGLLAWLSSCRPVRGRTEASLHGLALFTALFSALALALLSGLHFGGVKLPPIVVICVLLGLANAVYGLLAYWAPGLQLVALASLVGLALLMNSRLLDTNHAYKLTFPNLEGCYATPLRIDEELVATEGETHKRVDYYYDLLRRQAQGDAARPDLIDSEEPLRAMAKRWRDEHKDGSKPLLVLVCTSGGGIRAAVWTAVVLEGLEREIGAPFRDHLRMFTGASGGMVGAALYVADFENTPAGQRPINPATGLRGISGELAGDSLRRTVQTMLLHDLPSLWWRGPLSWDRGREIEEQWANNTPRNDGQSPFQKSFKDLAALEKEGRRPSLVFAPMLVEDARRLLISNLDLLDLTWTSGSVLSFEPLKEIYHLPAAPDRPLYALEAVEMFRLFPHAQARLQVGTAGRMNASFPLVSPGVSLPTSPPRRVVDAGYYDNYGVNLAARWLTLHEPAVHEHTSGVVVIEIRAYRNGYARWHFQDKEAEKYDPDPGHEGLPRRDRGALQASLQWLSTPAEAVLTARDRAAYYHNDELLAGLDRHFNSKEKDFFTTVAFECEVDAALSWTLPRQEAQRIAQAFYKPADERNPNGHMPCWIAARVEALKKWLGKGGRVR